MKFYPIMYKRQAEGNNPDISGGIAMNYLKSKKNRFYIALTGATLTALLAAALPEKHLPEPPAEAPVLAWWGSIYPEFCFAEKPEEEGGKIKTSFWLAELIKDITAQKP